MPRAWLVNGIFLASLVAILALAIAVSPAFAPPGDPPADARGARATPPPEWTDPTAVAVGRLVLEGPAAETFRALPEGVLVLAPEEYDIREDGLRVSPLLRLPETYAAAIEVEVAGKPEATRLYVFSGLDGLWAWAGDDERVDTSGRPAPFRLHAGPAMTYFHVWATDCLTRNPGLGEDAYRMGPSTYGVEPGPAFTFEFVDDAGPCAGFTATMRCLGLVPRVAL